ncbi:DUF4124 domain-containing protein [Chromobacterium subtsugae]|uniref:DUF4124 domain-containing protein n=1 Tax=Chromobacterium subtsugae TaxID=251747 RepID=A0ABS7F9E9_9NEIS|nr:MULTISPECIES: DUF4124 domain-containing protein [Chromobacterium]KUM02556.1 hypothetical protein Cv017_02255 [Chromobacterium subtsugae]KZE87941.1 hypothetical protein AWB61_09090 [Chromobacterium sp. F49]MBW7565437.1 DUF4124 domain-containing protein [Chromobacterium subtsugae]MBW8286713.1 DUF4124 domain-containing protein [Chromobacterium subtsugae]WSE90807.1 DUF4124 domain-containing protein [Chromobacterium subtsugae]
MQSSIVWTFLLALLLPGAAAAEVYTWTDANGKTVYSDQPPPHVNARKLNVRAQRPAGASAPKAEKKADSKPAANKQVASDNAAVAAANAKVKAQNCSAAQANLATLQQNGRIRMPGSTALATDAQRNELIRQAQKDVQTWCNK